MADNQLRGLRLAYVLMGVTDGSLLPFIPLYLLQQGLSPSGIGAVLAATAFVALVAGLGWAYLADRRLSPERLVVGAAFCAAAVSLLLLLPGARSVPGLLIVGLSLARSPLALLDPITLRRLRLSSRTDYARIRLRTSAGWAASAILTGGAYGMFGLALIPLIYAPLSTLLGIWIWRTIKPDPEPALGAVPSTAGMGGIPRVLLGFLGSLMLLGIALAATQNFLVLQIDLLGGGALLVGAAAAFQALTEIPTMGYIHVLTKRFSHRILFAIGCAIYLAIFVAWAFAGSALVAALLKLGVGVAFALTFVSAVMIANDLVPARLRATGQALVKSVLFGAAPIVGAFGGGVVYGSYGARVMFLASTFVVVAAGVIALVVVPARRAVPAGEPVLAASAATP